MRVTLFHRPSAGEATHARADLVGLFEAHGHTVAYCSLDDAGWPAALDAPADAVAVAGGDGTLEAVAPHILGRGWPLLLLPFGTANNLALRLGLGDDIETLIAGLDGAERRPFDVGVARGPWGARRFLEGVGLGAFARAMAFAKTEQGALIPDPSEREATLGRDLRLLRAVLRDFDAHRCALGLDGAEAEEATYLLLEASNTGFLGPNVALAPEANCRDGRLDVVVAGEAERERLEAYLDARLAGEEAPALDLPVRRAREVRFTVSGVRLHLDGAVWPGEDAPPPASDAPFEVVLTVEAGALDVLVPA